MPIILDEDSEFNLVIVVEKEKESVASSDRKYLLFQCEECKKQGLSAPENSLLIYTEKVDEAEKMPKTPVTNPFTNRNDNLSFKEVFGTNKSPSLERSPPTTTRSKFDFNFFQSAMNAGIDC